MRFEDFKQDGVVRRAIERSFAIISEASVKLGVSIEKDIPDIPWPDIRGLGNVIRHEYGDIDYLTIWEIKENDLDALKQACLNALDKARQP